MNKPFGYWTFNGGNGLVGAESTLVTLPDGRRILQKDPDNPAALEDDFILHALSHSVPARASFEKIFPTLDEVSQNRLRVMLKRHPQMSYLLKSSNDWADQIQSKEIRAGVRVRMPKPKRR